MGKFMDTIKYLEWLLRNTLRFTCGVLYDSSKNHEKFFLLGICLVVIKMYQNGTKKSAGSFKRINMKIGVLRLFNKGKI